MLWEPSGDILDDETLINTLDTSKKTSEEIKEKLELVEITEKETKDIDTARSQYVSVLFRSSLQYFFVSDLLVIDPMYQYSLEWFKWDFVVGSWDHCKT
jgi:dynein heavy chain